MDYVSDTLIINERIHVRTTTARVLVMRACLISDLIDTLVSVRQPANKGLERVGCMPGLISEENLPFSFTFVYRVVLHFYLTNI